MMLRPSNPALVKLLVASLALWQAGAWFQQRLVQWRQAPDDKLSELATWEGEGGALRSAGSQMGPQPAEH
jgi:hypothetical protein